MSTIRRRDYKLEPESKEVETKVVARGSNEVEACSQKIRDKH